jgi:hypothetical protein
MKISSKAKRIGIDAAGYTCVVLALLLGWLPGPGGTPLMLTGLGLLSIHNVWAQRFLHYLKTEGLRLADVIFPDRKIIALLWDITLIGLVVGAFFIYTDYSGLIATVAGSFCLAVALYIVALNRKRWEKAIEVYKRRQQKN